MGPESRYMTVMIGVVNCFLCFYVLALGYYISKDLYESCTTISLSILVCVQLLVNLLLTVGAIKTIPFLLLPWLGVQAGNLGISVFCLAFTVFFGKIHLDLSTAEFNCIILGISVYTGATLICCMVVVKFRKDASKNPEQLQGDLENICAAAEAKDPPPAYSAMEGENVWKGTLVDPPPLYEEAMAMSDGTLYTSRI